MRARHLGIGGLAALSWACAANPSIATRGDCTFATAPAAPKGGEVTYAVTASLAARELCIEAVVPKSAAAPHVTPRLAPFVRDLMVQSGQAWTPIAFGAPLGCKDDCRIRYRFELRDAGRALRDQDVAMSDGPVIFSPLSTWLLRPGGLSPDTRFVARVVTPPPVVFMSGTFVSRSSGEGNAYEGRLADLTQSPYSAFGPLRVHTITLGDATVDVGFTPGRTGVTEERLLAWITTNTRAVAAYFNGYPIRHALVIVRAGGDGGIGGGTTMGEGGGAIILQVGAETTEADLAEDWVLVHEMVHVSFPSVLKPWAEEGLATYVEPLIRVQAGLLDRDKVWRDLLLGLPKGQPEAGDEGLDRTDTWGRRYWGGALFWFLADVKIREATHNERSIQDALRAIVVAGGNVAVTWPFEKALGVGDRAVGGTVLVDLYHSLSRTPVTADLDGIFARLGVGIRNERVVYDDAAPLADVRKAITAPR